MELSNKGRYVCKVDVRPEAMPNNGMAPGPSSSALHSSSSSDRLYNDDGGRRRKREEKSLDLRVLELRKPEMSFGDSNMWDNLTVVEEPEDGLRLACRLNGRARPRPTVTWTLNGRRLLPTANTTRVQLTEGGQLLRVSYVTAEFEGVYACLARNKVGATSARQLVRLRSTVEADERFATLSYPVVAAVGASVFLVFLLVVLAKLFYSNCRLRRCFGCCCGAKVPPTPPTAAAAGRLRQYEMPHHSVKRGEDDEDGASSGLGGCSSAVDDECHVALTSAAALNHHNLFHGRDGSVSPYGHCGGGGSLVNGSLSPPLPMAHYCHCHHFSGCPSAAASQVHHEISLLLKIFYFSELFCL